MKMDEMNAYFESKGFEVERKYHNDGRRQYYEFIISKGDYHHSGHYEWPCDQRRFMDRMIENFDKVFVNSIYGKSACSELYISTYNPYIRNDAISAMVEAGNFAKYIENDVKSVKEMWTKMNPYLYSYGRDLPKIKDVIFNDPATIVFWSDNTKTVVKCQNDDVFDPEKGLAMAISKKALGNKGNYCNELKKWLPETETEKEAFLYDIKLPDPSHITKAAEAFRKLGEDLKKIRKQSPIQKAYDRLVAYRDATTCTADAQINPDRDILLDIDEVIGYLGQALED